LRRFQEGQYGEKFGYDPEEEKRRLQEGQYGTKFTFDKEGLEEEVRTQVPEEIDVPVNVNAVTGDVTLPEVSAIEEDDIAKYGFLKMNGDYLTLTNEEELFSMLHLFFAETK